MKQKHFIDSHKGITFVAVLIMMAVYDQWQNTTAWVYLALHGTYGILWVVKSRVYGDRHWEERTSLWYGLVIWGGLTLYWIAPWLLTSRGIEAPPWQLGLCVVLYSIGLFFHFVSDMQKHTALRLRPGLVRDGLWAWCRNPNYFGELLIYLGFGLLARHWLPLVVIALYVAFVWFPNMRRKDRSLARYPEFADWKAQTSLFIPFVL
jgi:protein-S-isoprenylcysteine O-methyltransferase Ste14